MNGGGKHEEADLVRRAKHKDTAAVRAIYDSYAQYLFAVCRRYTGDSESAADVLQDSFVKIFTSLDSFEWRGEGSLKSWMRRIVVNEALMFLRSRRRDGEFLSSDGLPETAEEDEPDVDDIPMQELQRMICELPEGYRTVFNLYVFEKMSHREIAAALGISENTSYSQFSRARSLLARKINEFRKNG